MPLRFLLLPAIILTIAASPNAAIAGDSVAFETKLVCTEYGHSIETTLRNHSSTDIELDYFSTPAAYYANGLDLELRASSSKLELHVPLDPSNSEVTIAAGSELVQRFLLPFHPEESDVGPFNLSWAFELAHENAVKHWDGTTTIEFSDCPEQ